MAREGALLKLGADATLPQGSPDASALVRWLAMQECRRMMWLVDAAPDFAAQRVAQILRDHGALEIARSGQCAYILQDASLGCRFRIQTTPGSSRSCAIVVDIDTAPARLKIQRLVATSLAAILVLFTLVSMFLGTSLVVTHIHHVIALFLWGTMTIVQTRRGALKAGTERVQDCQRMLRAHLSNSCHTPQT